MTGGLSNGSGPCWWLRELYITCFRQYRRCKSHRHNVLIYFRQPRKIRFWIVTARRLMILIYQITWCRISERHNLQPPSNAFSLTIRFSIAEKKWQFLGYSAAVYVLRTHVCVCVYIYNTHTPKLCWHFQHMTPVVPSTCNPFTICGFANYQNPLKNHQTLSNGSELENELKEGIFVTIFNLRFS
jgi:hypothetical protein